MKIAIGCDHRGYKLKESLKRSLSRNGHKVSDFGTYSKETCDYPEFSSKVARAVANGRQDRGILICLTGIGSSIVANKVPGVRAALCHTIKSAKFSRRHNDANVLVLASGVVGKARAKEIVSGWLATDFEGGRHARRVRQIAKIERELAKLKVKS